MSGTGEAGATVTIFDNGEAIGQTEVNADGRWYFQPETSLPEGNLSITTTQMDKAGNVSDISDGRYFVVDTVAPDKPVVGSVADDVGPVRGDLASGSVTDDARPTLKGTAEPGSRVDIYDNGELLGSVTTDEYGAWSFTPTTPLPEGGHHITATDKAGNTSEPSDEFVLTTDYTPPVATEEVLKITGVTDDVGDRQGNVASSETTDDSKPLITGIGEAGNTVFVYSTDSAGKHLIGSVVAGSDGTWCLIPDTPLTEGLNQLTLETRDPAGNHAVGQAPSYDITILIPVGSEPSIGSVVDNVEPHTGPLQKGDVTNDSTPTNYSVI